VDGGDAGDDERTWRTLAREPHTTVDCFQTSWTKPVKTCYCLWAIDDELRLPLKK
jgi:hypothetical protein